MDLGQIKPVAVVCLTALGADRYLTWPAFSGFEALGVLGGSLDIRLDWTRLARLE